MADLSAEPATVPGEDPSAEPAPDRGEGSAGPLAGIRVVELAGIGPGPFAASLLADMGASVTRVVRPGDDTLGPVAAVLTGARPSVERDLADPAAREQVLGLVEDSDVLLEGFRPGVAERLGLGPEVCLARNPALVYGRVTGWGQDGPLAARAGHDINYTALTGALASFARRGQPPVVPLNLVADFAGGSMFLLFGVLCALVERQRSGLGQVVDAAMVDGVSRLLAMAHEMRGLGAWSEEPGTNLLDTGAPFYDVYRTADGGLVAVGPLEPRFYAELLAGLGLDPRDLPDQYDRRGWPVLRARFTAVFATRTRVEWDAVFAGTDACVTPVLGLDEAPAHPHLAARGTYDWHAGAWVPAVAPRLSRTPGRSRRLPPTDQRDDHRSAP